MQTTPSLIHHFLVQDMRHQQLVHLLESQGADSDLHYLDIMSGIARLMGYESTSVSDQWAAIYTSFMDQAAALPICGRGDHLLPLAKECYQMLQACAQIEARINMGMAS